MAKKAGVGKYQTVSMGITPSFGQEGKYQTVPVGTWYKCQTVLPVVLY